MNKNKIIMRRKKNIKNVVARCAVFMQPDVQAFGNLCTRGRISAVPRYQGS